MSKTKRSNRCIGLRRWTQITETNQESLRWAWISFLSTKKVQVVMRAQEQLLAPNVENNLGVRIESAAPRAACPY